MAKYFDVIVAGAGPAGSISALKLARAGLKVALVERGSQPGNKNIFGGLLHSTPVLNEIFPDFWEKAPLERHVYKKTLSFMTPESALNLAFETEKFENTPYNGYTVMRPIFDNWLAEEAVKSGATLLCNCTAENVLREGNRVVGITIKGREGELRSQVLIAADGVLSFLAQKAGLRQDIKIENMGLGVKLLLGMPYEVINERFGLVRDEGADYSMLGLTEGLRGGGFLYTNNDSLSVGLVVHIGSLKETGKTPYDILNHMLEHPHIRKLVNGGIPLEYSAHLVPEGGVQGIPGLFTAGMLVVGDAAGLCYTNGINLEGINLALTSGALAAETVIEAFKCKDYSLASLSQYQNKLKSSFVLKDMQTFKHSVEMMHINRLFTLYPELACSVFEKIYRVDGKPRDRIFKLLRKEMKGKIKTGDLLGDGFKMGRTLL